MTEAMQTATFGATTSTGPGVLPELTRSFLGRAAVVALILGSILALINQSGAIFGSDDIRPLSLALVFLTPFVVVTISQVLGARQAALDARRGKTSASARETFVETALAHGIPSRSLFVGLLAGSVNATVITTMALLEGGDLSTVPLSLLGQAFILPVLFGVLSQAITYRRTVKATLENSAVR